MVAPSLSLPSIQVLPPCIPMILRMVASPIPLPPCEFELNVVLSVTTPSITKSGWFAARPSGTEDIYKIYAESFKGHDHLKQLIAEAQVIVDKAIS